MPSEELSSKVLAWYHSYKNGVYGYVYNLTRSHHDTEDILQTVFLSILNLGEKIHAIRHPKTYIFRAARNEALRKLKHRNNSETSLELLTEDVHVEDGVQEWIDKETITQALDNLAADEREILIMRAYERMTFREIAGVTGRFLPTVTTKYYRAIRKLKAYLEGYYENR